MSRPLFTVLLVLSLLLCAATIVVWARSYWVSDRFSLTTWYVANGKPWCAQFDLYSNAGVLTAMRSPNGELPAAASKMAGESSWSFHREPAYGIDSKRFIAWVDRSFGSWAFCVRIPCWLVVGSTGALSGSLFVARRLRNRIGGQSPRCAVCGYDLRATPERCPECGTFSAGDLT